MSRSSKRWNQEHQHDLYVKKAHKEKYRSRSAYKLIQIQEKFQVMRPGDWILDLGSAPGGWSQVAAGISGERGRVVSVDLVKMDPFPGVRIVQGDIMEDSGIEKIRSELEGRKADLILSDMASNTTGIASVDHDRSVLLVDAVLELVPLFLRHGGGLIFKVFQGKDFKTLKEKAFSLFEKGRVFKPDASRSRSVEVYLIGMQYRGIGLFPGSMV
ncbi:MAG: RlmE family RNA methyltransferase [bacterium]